MCIFFYLGEGTASVMGGGGIGTPNIAETTNGTTIGPAQKTTTAAAQKKPVRRGGKAQPDRPVRALFCLGVKNPLRSLCISVVEWKYPFYIWKSFQFGLFYLYFYTNRYIYHTFFYLFILL